MGVASMAFNTVKDIATGLGAAALAFVMVAGTPANDAQAGDISSRNISDAEAEKRYEEICGPGLTLAWFEANWNKMTVGEYLDFLEGRKFSDGTFGPYSPEHCAISFHATKVWALVQDPQHAEIRQEIERCNDELLTFSLGRGVGAYMHFMIPTFVSHMRVMDAANSTLLDYCVAGRRLPESYNTSYMTPSGGPVRN